MTAAKNSVIVVGGGIRYQRRLLAGGKRPLGDGPGPIDVPNQWSASGDQLRVFRMTYGKDAF